MVFLRLSSSDRCSGIEKIGSISERNPYARSLFCSVSSDILRSFATLSLFLESNLTRFHPKKKFIKSPIIDIITATITKLHFMFATNFESIDSKKITKLFDFIRNNQFSNFYSPKMHLFGSRNPEIYEEFSRFPFLTKNEILDRPIVERTYADPRSIQLYAISSGTSKHAIPTIIPHTVRNYHELDCHGYANIKKDGPINLMLLLNGVNSSLISFMDNWENKNVVFTIGNVTNLRASAIIAREIGVSAIVTTPSILYAFMKELKAANFDLDTIAWISL